MLIDRPRHQVLIGNKDVTDRCDSIVYSATDTGGYEICTLGLPSTDRPLKGTSITIRQGLEVAWQGRVAEVADHSQHGRATKTTGGEGLVALLRDNPMQMVYIARDLGTWATPSIARQLALTTASIGTDAFQFATEDDSTGNPGIGITTTGPIVTTTVHQRSEAWYDAGANNLLHAFNYSMLNGLNLTINDANSTLKVGSSPDGIASLGELSFKNDVSFASALSADARFAYFYWDYSTGASTGTAGATFGFTLANIAVFGNHGLALRLGQSGISPGADDGFYPSDIVQHVLSQTSGISSGVILDSTGYVAPHVTYPTPTGMDVIIQDMATLMGWPWGVWDSGNVMSLTPRLDFRPPPSDATAVITKAECDQLDVTSRLGDLYSTALITYSDAAGTAGLATVTLANPQLIETGIQGRTLLLDMGQSSGPAAATFGLFALALSQVSARAAGQATLPGSVRLPGGGSKPACLLRPGIDRLRIVDLVDGGPLFDIGTARRDVFRISRVETTVGTDGSVSTRVELDNGTNLLETLQARLALSAGVVGSGASGG